MNPDVRHLFREVADLPPEERERVFAARAVAPELRAEVESLLNFDRNRDRAVTDSIASVVSRALRSADGPRDSLCGPYRLIRLLGSGGMGSVYLGERADGEIQQQVAIKLLRAGEDRPSWNDRFLKERQLLAYLNHPAVARLLDAGHTQDGQPYLVMEYVDGTPIDSYAVGKTLREQLNLFLRVCEGVTHAHRHLIIHRDLKPSNILVDPSGQPKLLDFGIAKLIDQTADPTQTVERLLTPAYASPEQLRGAVQSTATDIYSLGAVLYKLLTGRSPHESDTGTSRAIEIVTGNREIAAPTRINPDLPADLDYVVRKALRREPEERYASADALAEDIRAFLNLRPVAARSGDAWYRARKFVRRRSLPVAAVGLTVVGLSLGLLAANHERAAAQRRFQEVRQLAAKLIDLDSDIRDLPGATNARKRIVSTSLVYLAALGPEAGGDKDLALEIGDAYLQLARIQGVPIHSNLGQFDAAKDSLRKADGFVNSVLAADPGNRKALLASAEIAHDRMSIASSERNVPDALAQARETEARLQRLSAYHDLRPEEIAPMARIYSNLAIVYGNGHRFDDSIRAARHGIEISRDVPAARTYLALSLGSLASGLRWTGDLDGALAAIRQSRRILETTSNRGVAYRLNLFERLFREGRILDERSDVNMDRPAEAAIVLQKALDLVEDMAQKDPHDSASRHRISGAAAVLGDILCQTDPAKALALYDHALLRVREIENNRDAQRDEIDLLTSSSYALRRLHRENEAAQRIDRAFEVLREMKEYPADRIVPIDSAHSVVRALADHYAETGNLAKAAASYREMLDKQMASNPDPEHDLRNATYISNDEVQFVGVLRRLGQTQEANDLESQRQALWRLWDRKLPNNAFVRRQLAARAN